MKHPEFGWHKLCVSYNFQNEQRLFTHSSFNDWDCALC